MVLYHELFDKDEKKEGGIGNGIFCQKATNPKR